MASSQAPVDELEVGEDDGDGDDTAAAAKVVLAKEQAKDGRPKGKNIELLPRLGLPQVGERQQKLEELQKCN